MSSAAFGVWIGSWLSYALAALNLLNCAAMVFLIVRWLHVYRKERGFK
jgi:hypothetical protein